MNLSSAGCARPRLWIVCGLLALVVAAAPALADTPLPRPRPAHGEPTAAGAAPVLQRTPAFYMPAAATVPFAYRSAPSIMLASAVFAPEFLGPRASPGLLWVPPLAATLSAPSHPREAAAAAISALVAPALPRPRPAHAARVASLAEADEASETVVAAGSTVTAFVRVPLARPSLPPAASVCPLVTHAAAQGDGGVLRGKVIDGPGSCGIANPVRLTAAGSIRFAHAADLDCQMATRFHDFLLRTVDPLARRHLGAPVVGVPLGESYDCRPRSGIKGAKLSEHGHGNAFDLHGVVLADGRTVSVEKGWRGGRSEQAFWRAVHEAACQQFMTVLGPEADSFHYNHLHLDLAPRRSGLHYCR